MKAEILPDGSIRVERGSTVSLFHPTCSCAEDTGEVRLALSPDRRPGRSALRTVCEVCRAPYEPPIGIRLARD